MYHSFLIPPSLPYTIRVFPSWPHSYMLFHNSDTSYSLHMYFQVGLIAKCYLIILIHHHLLRGFPGGTSGKEFACQCRRCGFDPWIRKIPLEEGMATHSSILAWRIPWTGRLQSKNWTGLKKCLALCLALYINI